MFRDREQGAHTATWEPEKHAVKRGVDSGQTRRICEKQENYFKGKVVTFTVQSFILNQYPVVLPTFLELY